MANNLIQIKRTSVAGRAANTTTLQNPGELAINMTDGIMYSTNGSVVFEIGANNTNAEVTGTLTVNTLTANGTTGASGQVLTSNGTIAYWADVSGGGGASVTSSATAPSSPTAGDLWFNTENGTLLVYYNDGADEAQWVVVSGPEGPQAEAQVTTGKAIAMAIVFG